mgnify:CR=1 FL=1
MLAINNIISIIKMSQETQINNLGGGISDEDSKLLNVQAAEPTAYICSLPRIKVAPNQSNSKS